MAVKTDQEIKAEIHKKIEERLDSIETLIQENEDLHAKRIQLKDREIRNLEREIIKLADGIARVCNHNEAARTAVIQQIGLHHGHVTRYVLERRKEITNA